MRISVLGLILMFLFPITLFAQQRVDVTGKTLVVSNNGEGQEVFALYQYLGTRRPGIPTLR